MFLSKREVEEKITKAIINKIVLLIKYQHVSVDNDIVERRMAPFDIGTSNKKMHDSNKDNVYLFCFDHIDNKTGLEKQMVHPINIEHIISIIETGDIFDENDLADINLKNTNYDYRKCQFAVLPERNWFN